MNIVICDAKQEDREKCRDMVKSLAEKHKIPVDIKVMDSSKQLLFECEDNRQNVDLMYLDVPFPEIDGMQTAVDLRKHDVQGDIVFFTMEKSRVFEAFDVDALHYLIKSEISGKKFESVFLKAARRAEKRNTETIMLTCAGEHRQIAVSDIKYFEVQNRIITIHYGDNTFEFYSTLAKIEEMLTGQGFERVHKSFLVAKKFIQEINRNQLKLMDGQVLPVSRQYFYHREKTA